MICSPLSRELKAPGGSEPLFTAHLLSGYCTPPPPASVTPLWEGVGAVSGAPALGQMQPPGSYLAIRSPPLCSLPPLIHHGSDSCTDCGPLSTMGGSADHLSPRPRVLMAQAPEPEISAKCELSGQGQRRTSPREREEIKKKNPLQLLYLMRVMAN